MKKLTIVALLAVFIFSFTTVGAAKGKVVFPEHEVTVPLRFDYFYTYEMVNDALQKLHKAYPQLTKLDLVGKSEEGRSIYCMTVNNPKTGSVLDKPAIYVDGNIHGNELQGGEVGLYLLDYLLGNYGKIKEVTQLVDKKVFYVVPVVNVDGRWHYMHEANTDSSSRSLRRPKDDDNDGLFDEDYPDDLDGDGSITVMRKRDPNGKFKTDPKDPRLMVRVKPGEKGEWTILGDEGIDNDGDGRINEDSEGYVDPNRNWGFDWQPNYVQMGSGDFPNSGVGLKALAEYLRKLPNICMVWAFHNFGGMILRGPSTKVQPEYHPKDVEVYDHMGFQSERILPGYKYMISWKDLYPTYGDFSEWMAMTFGTYSYVGEITNPGREMNFQTFDERKKPLKEEGEEEGGGMFNRNEDEERQQLDFNDHLAQGELFREWKSYNHPTFGKIEIGGWVKNSQRLPATFIIKDMVHRNASAVLFTAKQTPEVSMKVFEKKKIGAGLYRIRVRLTNANAMPTMSYHAQQKNLYPKDMLKVSGAAIKVVAGGALTDVYRDTVTYKEHRPELQFLFVPGFDKVDYQFLVSGSGSVTIKYSSRHAKDLSKTITLQ